MAGSPFVRFHHVVAAVDNPVAAAGDWSRLFRTPITDGERGPAIAAGDAWIEFELGNGDSAHVARVAVEVDEPATVAAAAERAGAVAGRAPSDHRVVTANGVHVELRPRTPRFPAPRDGMFTRVHHLVVAVADDERALALWRAAFSFDPLPEGPAGEVHRHHVPVGDAWFGLTAAGTDAGALARFVARRGEGVYALSLVVADRDAAAAAVAAAGGRVIGEPGAYQRFVHPASTHGILVELAHEWPGGAAAARPGRTPAI